MKEKRFKEKINNLINKIWDELNSNYQFKPIDCYFIKKTYFRSGLLNTNDNRIRVSIDIDHKDWPKLKSQLNIITGLQNEKGIGRTISQEIS